MHRTRLPRTRLPLAAALGAGLTLAAAPAMSSTMDATKFFTQLTPLNDSGIRGRAEFSVDRAANTITATVRASGLTPNTLHPQHIHGRFQEDSCVINAPPSSPVSGLCLDGPESRESNIPSVAENDIDGDGFLETVEGAPAYGPIILNLADSDQPRTALPGSFPMSDGEGNLFFTETYDLDTTDLLFDSLNEIEHEPGDLFSLTERVYVLHGVTVNNPNPAVLNDMFEIQGPTNGSEFITLLPGAAGEIAPIPVPAAGVLLVAALGGLGALRARRKA